MRRVSILIDPAATSQASLKLPEHEHSNVETDSGPVASASSTNDISDPLPSPIPDAAQPAIPSSDVAESLPAQPLGPSLATIPGNVPRRRALSIQRLKSLVSSSSSKDPTLTKTVVHVEHKTSTNLSPSTPKLRHRLSKPNHVAQQATRAPGNDSHVSIVTASLKSLLTGTNLNHIDAPKKKAVPNKQHAETLTKVQPALLKDESANKTIAEVRTLSPLYGGNVKSVGEVTVAGQAIVTSPSSNAVLPTSTSNSSTETATSIAISRHPPVHAVCLDWTDEEVDKLFFNPQSRNTVSTLGPLRSPTSNNDITNTFKTNTATITNDFETLAHAFENIKLVNILRSSSDAHEPSPQSSPLPPTLAPVRTLSALAIPPPAESNSEPEAGIEPPTISPIPSPTPEASGGTDAILLGAFPSPAAVFDGLNELAEQLIAIGLGDPDTLIFPSSRGGGGAGGLPGYQLGGPGGLGGRGRAGPGGQGAGAGTEAGMDVTQLLPDHKGVYPPTDRLSVLTCKSVFPFFLQADLLILFVCLQ